MKVNVFRLTATIALSAALGGAVLVHAAGSQGSPSAQALKALDGQTVTVTGCLMTETTVAGQTPNPVERAGVAPDFILTNVQLKSASPSGAGTTAGAAAAGAAKAAEMPKGTNVKLTGVDNDQMRTNLKQQVEVTGKLSVKETVAGAVTGAIGQAATLGKDQKLPELQVATVRPTGQSCSAQQ